MEKRTMINVFFDILLMYLFTVLIFFVSFFIADRGLVVIGSVFFSVGLLGIVFFFTKLLLKPPLFGMIKKVE